MVYRTANCIFPQCRKWAKIYGGHVHSENRTIFAGFCEKHHKKRKVKPLKNCKLSEGCFGEWKKEYGMI